MTWIVALFSILFISCVAALGGYMYGVHCVLKRQYENRYPGPKWNKDGSVRQRHMEN